MIGAPDPKWGQRPVAFVATWPGRTLTSDGLLGFIESRLAKYKLPREIHLIPRLPRNAAGKVIRSELENLRKTEE